MLEIQQGDCLELLKHYPESYFDCVVTSPPYNIGKEYNSYKDNLKEKVYLEWMEKVFIAVKRVMKDDASFFVNMGTACKTPYLKMDVAQMARQHFVLQNDIIWAKSITVNEQSYGHFKPINSPRFLNPLHESVYHFTKDGKVLIDHLAIGVKYVDKFNIERFESNIHGDKRCRGNIWHIPHKTAHGQKSHPAGFPVELPEMCIKLHGLKEGMKVLDPFLGCGSTLQACKKLNISGVGLELDAEYCLIAQENIS